ncbi:Type 4 prepilin-like proteins leader peptide-processing enzyme [Pseudobythopirellula maris]|uniref:Type 4 prepilin-like proteins leader peptide-processing enzyme n=1 Tax=Pseudobythopirellula maris TaxID=2527991 RepID=A0A5C5ZI68_9BACT|nr:A24 family peptidase [Pseudobythopirellula maris]TWT86830.1 Type 4 prepilin-like proteins leader peptide-processing enzyme [Pseudobythopirellula maris]
MDWLLTIPLAVRVAVVFFAAASVATLLNAATYAWAWRPRQFSPWQGEAEGVAPRTWADRLPVIGWLRLRRDAAVLGRGYWVRPMLVEALFGAALAWLYAFEVDGLGLIVEQSPAARLDPAPLAWATHATFAAHALLACLMLVATLIDIDDKIIPDEVTVPGTLLGLVLMTLAPLALPPNIQESGAQPPASVELATAVGAPLRGMAGDPVRLVPTHVAAPRVWPEALAGFPQGSGSLLLGLGCYWLWCFALTTRIWRARGGVLRGLGVLLVRVGRDLRSTPLREILIVGSLLIAMAWRVGGGAWQGLLTALVGMVLSGGLVWLVRLIGSAALGKEAMGFGDVTLMMMIGAFLGWQAGLMIFFLAPFAGLVIGVMQLVLRRDDVIPYGPFLCLAAAFVVVRWPHLWERTEPLFDAGPLVPVVLLVCLVMLGVLLALWRQVKVRLLGVSED